MSMLSNIALLVGRCGCPSNRPRVSAKTGRQVRGGLAGTSRVWHAGHAAERIRIGNN
jgi:hypothetical protein